MKPTSFFFKPNNNTNGLRLVMIAALTALLMFTCSPPGGGGGGTTVATPTFNPDPLAASIEQDTQSIIISTTTVGAAIYYNVDSAVNPTAASTPYAGAIPASDFATGPHTIKAIGVMTGSANSAVAPATYTVVDTLAPIPVITAPPGVNGDFQITVTFNEDVTDFTGDVLSLASGDYHTITPVSASVYTIEVRTDSFIVGDNSFTVTAGANAGACQDSSGNTNTVSAQVSVYYDPNAPTPTIIQTGTPGPTNTSPIPIEITFDRAVQNFDGSDIRLTVNPVVTAAVTNFLAVDTQHYTAAITLSADTTLTVDVDAGVCQSTITPSTNVAAAPLSVIYDSVAPALSSVTPATGGYAVSSPVTITVDWTESVTGFDAGDITNPVNCGVSNFSGSGSSYSFDVTPGSEAAFSFDIAAGVCADAALNASSGSIAWSRTYHSTVPSVSSIAPATGGYWTAAGALSFTVDWNEAVTGFDINDIGALVNCTVDNFSGSGAGYTFDLTPSGQGNFGFTIPAAACVDIASTASTGPVAWSRTFDTVAPGVSTVTPATGGFTAISPVTVTVDWSESVAGFTLGDIGTLDNCTVDNFSGSGAGYSFDVTPSSEAAFGFTIAASAVADAAGNPNTAASVWSMIYSASMPYITGVSPATGGYYDTTPVPVSITWDKTVTGFDVSDIGSLDNCTVSNFSGSGTAYTFDLTPTLQGAFGFTIPTGACIDVASNPSAGPVAWSRTYDSVAPSVSNVSPATGGYTATSPFPVTITWNESVSGFTTGDIGALVNGSVSNFSGSGDTYTFDFTPSAQGVFGFTIGSSACADPAGNPSTGTTVWSKTYHTTIPAIASISPATGGYYTATPVAMTVTWNEDVSGFTAGDIGSLVNGGVSNFAGSGDTYTFDFTPSGQGTFGFTIAASACQDIAGNNSSGPEAWSRVFDTAAPGVLSVSPATGGYQTGSSVTLTVTWSESVSGFTALDIGSLVNGGVSNFSGSGDTYSFDLSPTGQGAFGFTIDASGSADQAGNPGTGTTVWSKTYDSVGPSATLNQTLGQNDPTNASPVNFTVVFSESVSDFTSSDVTLSGTAGATTAVVTGSGTTYNIAVSGMTSAGTVVASLASAVAHDAAGNPNAGSTSSDNSVTFDAFGPTVTIEQAAAQADPTAASPINFTVVFNESVSDFATGDVTLAGTAGATTATVTGSGTTYNVAVSGMTGSGDVSTSLAAGIAHDALGNASGASTSTDNSVAYNTTYSVTYSGNGNTGGTAPTDGTAYIAGNTVTVLGNTGSLTRTGFSFVGWCVNSDGSGTSYIPTNTFAMGTSNVTLYAKWSALPTYTVTYAGNGNTGGTVPVDGTSYIEGSNVTVMGNTGGLVRTGFSFVGWDDLAASAFYTPGNQFVIDGNITLTATWSANPTYTVTYYGNGSTGGTVPTDSTNYENGALVTVSGNTGNLAQTGYNFTGWNTAANGSGTSYNGGNTFNMGSANVGLYAQWSVQTIFHVTYDGNLSTGGSVPVDGTSYLSGATVTVLGNTGSLVRTGYAFTGWNTQANGSGTTYNPAQTFAMGSLDVTLYGLWSEDSATSWTDLHSASLPYAAYDAVATSADGAYVFAVIRDGTGAAAGIYRSTDSGATWARPATAATARTYRCVATSATGQYVIAGVSTGNIYVSTNYGATWTSRASSRAWRGLAVSADGTEMYGLVNAGGVWRSLDFGTTWTQVNTTARAYYAATVSSDGTTLAAVVNNGGIYTSTDSGVTMTLKLNMAAAWRGVSISDNGQIITGVIQAGTYPNSGVWVCNDPTKTFTTWTQTDTNSVSYRCVDMSSDGSKMGVGIKGTTGGYISFSSNYGANWYSRTYTGMLVWTGISASSTGGRFYVSNSSGGSGGSIWVYVQ